MTNPTGRDGDLDRLLKSTRLEPSAAPGGVCLDPDTLAAWTDGTLTAEEQTAAERHAADCARCQALLATMVRTEPAPPSRAERWSPWTIARWALPLSAAAALALWVAVDRGAVPASPTQSVAPGSTASSPAPSSHESADEATAASAKPSEPAHTTSREQDARAESKALAGRRDTPVRKESARDVPSELRDERAKVSTPAAASDRLAREEARPQQPLAQFRSAGPASPVPHAASPPAAKESVELPPATTPAPVPPTNAAPAAAPAEPAELPEARNLEETVRVESSRTLARTARARVAWSEVRSPDPLVRWRFSTIGVERTTDGGATWTREVGAQPTAILAGAAPSPSVCWLVGRSGLVLRFTGDRGWQRLTVPDAPDLVAVQATDAAHATVTLASGRRLTTGDGGVTWR